MSKLKPYLIRFNCPKKTTQRDVKKQVGEGAWRSSSSLQIDEVGELRMIKYGSGFRV